MLPPLMPFRRRGRQEPLAPCVRRVTGRRFHLRLWHSVEHGSCSAGLYVNLRDATLARDALVARMGGRPHTLLELWRATVEALDSLAARYPEHHWPRGLLPKYVIVAARGFTARAMIAGRLFELRRPRRTPEEAHAAFLLLLRREGIPELRRAAQQRVHARSATIRRRDAAAMREEALARDRAEVRALQRVGYYVPAICARLNLGVTRVRALLDPSVRRAQAAVLRREGMTERQIAAEMGIAFVVVQADRCHREPPASGRSPGGKICHDATRRSPSAMSASTA